MDTLKPQVARDDAFEENVVSLYRFDTDTDRERAKEAIGIALHRQRAEAKTDAAEPARDVVPEDRHLADVIQRRIEATLRSNGINAVCTMKSLPELIASYRPRCPEPARTDEADKLRETICQLGENAAKAAQDYAAEMERLREVLEPSGHTKAAYHGEFFFHVAETAFDEEAEEFIENQRKVYVPWTTVKEIMAAIRDRAASQALTNTNAPTSHQESDHD